MRCPGSCKPSETICARKAAWPSHEWRFCDDFKRLHFSQTSGHRPSANGRRDRVRRVAARRRLNAAPRRQAVVSAIEQMSRQGRDARPLLFRSVGSPYWPVSTCRRLFTASRGAKETNLSPCRRNRQKTRRRLRRVAHAVLNRCVWRAKRHGSADCRTCIPSSAVAARSPTSRKVGRQDGATLICFSCFANKRENAADWQP
jgi:hypothetical protein